MSIPSPRDAPQDALSAEIKVEDKPSQDLRMTLTAKLKLRHTPEQKALLDAVTFAYRNALNYTSAQAFEMGKISNANKIHKEVYTHLRSHFGLKSQCACSISRQVGAVYKQLWEKFRKHRQIEARRRRDGLKPRRFKGLDNPPKFASRSLAMQYKRDYSFKKHQHVSVNTLGKRLILPYEGYSKHLDQICNGAQIGAGTLWYDKHHKQYYLLVALTFALPTPQPTDYRRVIGVDVGQRYHAVATDTDNRTSFFSGQFAHHKKDHFARKRIQLQRQGTRSATRRLITLSGRERRFIAAHNHKLANDLLARFPDALIGLEDLTCIRERTEQRSAPKASKKARRNKRHRSQWSFAELQNFIAYKAPLVGSLVVKVDAHFTSQMCTQCGHTSKANRPKAGLIFRCKGCGHELHSDLLGGRNIALRTLAVRQDWVATGHLSTVPDVSCDEVKAERLRRYSELRWSTDTNLTTLVVGS